MWHNGLSINISLLTELFTVFFQKTKVLPKLSIVSLEFVARFYKGELEIGHGSARDALPDERDRNRYVLMEMGIGQT